MKNTNFKNNNLHITEDLNNKQTKIIKSIDKIRLQKELPGRYSQL